MKRFKVCDDKYLTELDTSLFMGGKMVGALFLGFISDKYGRRLVFFLSSALLVLSGPIAYLSPWYALYLVSRFISGFANSGKWRDQDRTIQRRPSWAVPWLTVERGSTLNLGTTLTGYILAIEMVDESNRVIPGTIWYFVNAVGNLGLLLIVYFVREWDKIMLCISIPFVTFLFYWKHLPESPRWLLLQGWVSNYKAYNIGYILWGI